MSSCTETILNKLNPGENTSRLARAQARSFAVNPGATENQGMRFRLKCNPDAETLPCAEKSLFVPCYRFEKRIHQLTG